MDLRDLVYDAEVINNISASSNEEDELDDGYVQVVEYNESQKAAGVENIKLTCIVGDIAPSKSNTSSGSKKIATPASQGVLVISLSFFRCNEIYFFEYCWNYSQEII